MATGFIQCKVGYFTCHLLRAVAWGVLLKIKQGEGICSLAPEAYTLTPRHGLVVLLKAHRSLTFTPSATMGLMQYSESQICLFQRCPGASRVVVPTQTG